MRWAIAGLLVLALLALFITPLVLGGWYGFTGPYYGRPFFFFPFGFFIFMAVVFIGFRLLLWGGGWGGRWRRGHYGGYGYYGGALEILDQRYARGEITKEQYEQMKRDIQARQA